MCTVFLLWSCLTPASFLSEITGTPAGGKAGVPQRNSVGGGEKSRKAGTEGVGKGGRGPLEVMVSRCAVIMTENLISALAICHVYPQTATGINEAWEEVSDHSCFVLNFVFCIWFSFI